MSHKPTALAAAIAVAIVAPPALARAYHSQSLDDLIARCSTVNTATLPQASLSRYGIDGNSNTGLLSCVVQKHAPGQEPENVPARVSAEYHTTGQPPEAVDIRESRGDGRFITYLGTYTLRTDGPLVFRVRIAAGGETVEMNFDDQTPSI